MIIEITLAQPTILLNKWQRLNKFERKKVCKDLAWEMRYKLGQAGWKVSNKPMQLCEIDVYRYSNVAPDWDGFYGGLKPLLDVLCAHHPTQSPHGLGVIQDDSPKYLRRLHAHPMQAPPKRGYTLLKIQDFTHELLG